MQLINDFGALFKSAAVAAGEALAAGTGDATEVEGQSIDRLGFDSAAVLIIFKAVLTDTEDVAFAVEVQESADDTTWDTAVELQASTVAVTSDGGTTEYGTVKIKDDLSGRKRYVRYNITPNLSAGATDTVHFGAVAVLGGAFELPQNG